MIRWIKNRLSEEEPANEVEETADEAKEDFAPVSVRVKPPVGVTVKPADTYIEGYNVEESEFDIDDEHSATVNDIKTTGIDPYNTGHFERSDLKKAIPEK